MPKLTRKLPSYRLHRVSGHAVVTLNGRDHYLGPRGSPESVEAYKRLIGDSIKVDLETNDALLDDFTLVVYVSSIITRLIGRAAGRSSNGWTQQAARGRPAETSANCQRRDSSSAGVRFLGAFARFDAIEL